MSRLLFFGRKSRLQSDKSLRSARGSAAAELAICLCLLFLFFAFPLFDFVTVGLRLAFVKFSCELAARNAAGATTFVKDRFTSPSAVNTAKYTVNMACSRFSGIRVSRVETSLIASPMSPAKSAFETRQPLPQPGANTEEFLYQYKVKIDAEVEPLITYNGNMLGSIPGVTCPFKISCSQQRVCEKPEGLIQ